ncbi:MAG TPA: hypothetical protein VFG76_06530 [Candidatus Polarisedimenticolia bacterium]|nr:hypothetical protein [Candidatus Polarisedimenticolia bacterium]
MIRTDLLIVAGICVMLAATPAAALERSAFTLEVLVDGAPLTEYSARGTTYIEARRGREYALRLGNHTGQRLAVALSVDGLNSIDAKTSGPGEAAKWILDPYQTITLQGWQTSSSTARRFYFTTEEASYGKWLGKTQNLGIISAAVFRERPREISEFLKEKDFVTAGPDAPAAESAPRAQSGKLRQEPKRADDYAATGIGQQVNHQVTRVHLDLEDTPAALLEIRYEYRDALVRLGVLRVPEPCGEDPLARRECARGFDGMEFAPDPFRPRCP